MMINFHRPNATFLWLTLGLFLILCPTGLSLGTGTAVVMSGLWAPAPPTSEEAYELRVDEIRILGPTDAEVSATITFFTRSLYTRYPSEEEKLNPTKTRKKKVELTCFIAVGLSHSEEISHSRIPPHHSTS